MWQSRWQPQPPHPQPALFQANCRVQHTPVCTSAPLDWFLGAFWTGRMGVLGAHPFAVWPLPAHFEPLGLKYWITLGLVYRYLWSGHRICSAKHRWACRSGQRHSFCTQLQGLALPCAPWRLRTPRSPGAQVLGAPLPAAAAQGATSQPASGRSMKPPMAGAAGRGSCWAAGPSGAVGAVSGLPSAPEARLWGEGTAGGHCPGLLEGLLCQPNCSGLPGAAGGTARLKTRRMHPISLLCSHASCSNYASPRGNKNVQSFILVLWTLLGSTSNLFKK